MIYLDSSALVKLALTEPETAALARWLAERADQPVISSAQYRAEVPRAIWCAEPGALPRSYRMLKRIARVALTQDVLDNSATLPPQGLSAAQAIHLASALAVRRDLTAFVAYDERLLAAAKDAGLPVAAPGSSRLKSRRSPRAEPWAGGTQRCRSEKKELSVQPMGGLHRLLRAQGSKPVLRAAAARTPRGRARARRKHPDPRSPAGIRRYRPGRNVVDLAVSHGCSAGRPDRPRHGAHAGRQTHAA